MGVPRTDMRNQLRARQCDRPIHHLSTDWTAGPNKGAFQPTRDEQEHNPSKMIDSVRTARIATRHQPRIEISESFGSSSSVQSDVLGSCIDFAAFRSFSRCQN